MFVNLGHLDVNKYIVIKSHLILQIFNLCITVTVVIIIAILMENTFIIFWLTAKCVVEV